MPLQIGWLGALMLLAGCTVGPDYVRPVQPVPASYRELGDWQTARPRDDGPLAGTWQAFGDPVLNQLLDRVRIDNLNIRQATAQYQQAAALADKAQAALLPTVGATVSATRSQTVVNSTTPSILPGINSRRTLSVDLSWELDLWGRLRRTLEANTASAQASAADLRAATLSAQASLVQNYVQVRALDQQRALYRDQLAGQERLLQIARNQHAAGTLSAGEVATAENLWRSTRAQALDLDIQRGQFEHAIALLLGVAPAEFSLPADPGQQPAMPHLPAGLPSELLERRPDIAAAERRVAAANAQIGVAKAAYFPVFSLGASTGFQSPRLANWLTLPQQVWSIGPSLAQPLFDGGNRQAVTRQAEAAHEAATLSYRQAVLTALQEVEDALLNVRLLDEEAQEQAGAIAATRRSLQQAEAQYAAGVVGAQAVTTARNTLLQQQRSAASLQGRQWVARAQLIKALGGEWTPETTQAVRNGEPPTLR